MFNWLETEVSWKVTPFVMLAVIVAIFTLAWTAGAEEVKGVIYRGPGGSYVQQPGEVVNQLENGRLLVTRTDGSQFYIDLTAKVAAPSAQYEIRYKPNGESYRVLVQSRATEVDLIQSEHDLRVMQDDRQFQLEAARLQQELKNDQHDNRVDWSEEARDWQRDRERAKEDERRAEERERRDKQDQRENLRRDAQRAVNNTADRAERVGRRLGDRLENFLQSQN